MGHVDRPPEGMQYILIVEDSRVQAEILKRILELKGYETDIAADGKQALEAVQVRTPDLIISDVIMPVMNGYDLCRALKQDEKYTRIPVILLTALSDTRDVALALQAGADNFITKPYQGDYIVQRVKAMLASGRQPAAGSATVKPVQFDHGGQTYSISLDRSQIIHFLLSAYEAAVIQHQEFQRSQKELRNINEKLSQLNKIISIGNSSQKPDDLINGILKKTMEVGGFETGALYILNPDKSVADLRYFLETKKSDIDYRLLVGTLNVSDTAHQDLFIHGVSRFVTISEHDTALERESIILRDLGAKCYALLPLMSGSDVIGAISLISHHPHDFSGQEKALLDSIGTEIGSAVQKTLLMKRLEEANDETNLYLDIMTHDINNANTGALGYLDFLIENLEGENRTFAETVRMSIGQTAEIIGNVSTIRRMHESKTRLKPVVLHDVLQNEIPRFPAVTFHYEPIRIEVYADDLAGQIFTNLIGNSAKFAGESAEITISALDLGEEVQVTVADNGPGVPDDLKPFIFDRFRKGGSKKSGKGLGLFITRHLVEGYGGRIWVEDRISGHHEKGAAVHFILKKAS